jgi:hypothetical protein
LGVVDDRAAGGRKRYTAVPPLKKRNASSFLHSADPLAGRGERHIGPHRARRDVRRLRDMEKEPEVG